MKKIIVIIVLFCVILNTQAQNNLENTPHKGQDPCERLTQIETNPFNPKNTEWYTMRNRFNWMDYINYHNGLKMAIPYFDVNDLYGGGLNSQRYFVNPFFDDNEAYLKHINLYDKPALFNTLVVDNDYSNFIQLVNQMDITSKEHGWELLWKFDGYESDGVTPISNASISQVKSLNFILYNRFTGMLRWFMAPKVNNTTYNELEPIIEFKNNTVASLFRNYNGLDQALDKPTIVLRAASPAQTSFSTQHLSMADFNISYDPCVCFFDSKLGYSLNGNTTAGIDLYGRLEGTASMLSLSASDAVNTDRLLSVYKNSVNSGFPHQVKNGLFEYKNYGKMVSDFKKLENKSNVFDDVYDASKVLADVAEFGYNLATSPSNPGNIVKALKSMKTISKVTGFASMPFKTDKGTKSPPMLIQAQMSLTGQLRSNTTLNGFSFDMFTPGSYNTSNDFVTLNSPNNPYRFEYPVYNQAMGLYALLKTPYKYKAESPLVEIPIRSVLFERKQIPNMMFSFYNHYFDSIQKFYTYSPQLSLKLKNDIQFTFNPAAQINFEATKIEAAWMIEVARLNADGTTIDNLWNFTSPNLNPTYSFDDGSTKMVYSSDFMPIECITQFVPTFNYGVNPEGRRITKEAIPGDFLNQSLLSLGLMQLENTLNNTKPTIVKTYLKINITYRYNKPNGQGLNDIVNFETYKYEVEGNEINNGILGLEGINGLNAPSSLLIENRHFTANETIFAWDEIKIKGNLTVDPGIAVTIKSAGEIIIDPESTIDPEIVLLIGNPALCNPNRILPTTITKSYCEDKALYQANETFSKTSKQNHSTIQPDGVKSNIYPNPTSDGNFTVELDLIEESFVEINVSDLAGKLLYSYHTKEQQTKGTFKQNIDNTNLNMGIYFVEIKTNKGNVTHKLIQSSQ